jgi:hypothetical protein
MLAVIIAKTLYGLSLERDTNIMMTVVGAGDQTVLYDYVFTLFHLYLFPYFSERKSVIHDENTKPKTDYVRNMQLDNRREMVVARREDELQRAVYELNNIFIKYNLRISVNKIKTVA